jgi:predicted transcriptional regulator
MMNHFNELENMGMMCRLNGGLISITGKGMKFTKQYSQLTNLIESVGL